MRKILCFLSALIIASFIFPLSNFSQTTGKIDGYVTDSKTGEPLPGAKFIIKGTKLGAASDVDGYFFMINIQPGIYTISASMMGYTTLTQTNIQVITEQTTKINYGQDRIWNCCFKYWWENGLFQCRRNDVR